jgi:broad specificity phosphatase PhoE
MDVILRLEPLAHEMERTREPILIVGHQGIHRILYAYFMGLSREDAPYVSIPLNTIIQLTPHAYGCHEKRFVFFDDRLPALCVVLVVVAHLVLLCLFLCKSLSDEEA